MVGNSRFEACRTRPAKATGMRELQSHDQIVGRSKPLAMRGEQHVVQLHKACRIVGRG